MDNFIFSVNVVTPLFVLMAIGYLLRRIHFLSIEFLGQLNRFVFRFLLPLMLIQDIRTSYTGDFSNIRLISASFIGIVLVIFLSFLIVPLLIKRKGQRGSIIQGIYRSNFLIYGMPLAKGIYGQAAVTHISMLMGIMIPFYNVAAVVILSIFSEDRKQKLSLKTLLYDMATNPLILGCFFGLLMGYFHVQLPHVVDSPLQQLANAAAPMALFVMGGEFQFSALKGNLTKVICISTVRLIIVPVLALSACVYLGFRGVDLAVLISLFATPAAMAGYIMAKNMGNDGELAAQIVVLTTACSCVTIFFFIYFLKAWGYL
ncbi:MAG: AEC family transporter [Candidatus Symbiothrix sp.]|jgi:predicted permease|nr:AEC family transporter [Candidatus Symbiothrix sp.]